MRPSRTIVFFVVVVAFLFCGENVQKRTILKKNEGQSAWPDLNIQNDTCILFGPHSTEIEKSL